MGKTRYTVKFRRKHILEEKSKHDALSDEEIRELYNLVEHFKKFLHRISPNESYKPF